MTEDAVREVSATEASERAGAGDDRALAAWEVASVVSSTVIAEWVVLALAPSSAPVLFPAALALTFILVSQRVRGETARELGWRLDNFWRALRLLIPPMLVVTAMLLLLGWLGGGINFLRWRGGASLYGLHTFGLIWALLQQYALQGFVNRRAQAVWGKGARSVILVAAVFALLHFPNPVLTLATFAGGLVWAAVYQREPNLLAVTFSHGLMTWMLVSTIPPALLKGLRVGYKFFG